MFHAQISLEAGGFDFDSVARRIATKMRDRHPHVFNGEDERTSARQAIAWEEQKAVERDARAAKSGRKPSALDGVALALPALMQAQKLQKRAAREGFDWEDLAPVIAKIREELEVEAKFRQDRTRSVYRTKPAIFCLHASISPATSGSTPRWPSAMLMQSLTGVFALSRTVLSGRVNLWQRQISKMETHWTAVKAKE